MNDLSPENAAEIRTIFGTTPRVEALGTTALATLLSFPYTFRFYGWLMPGDTFEATIERTNNANEYDLDISYDLSEMISVGLPLALTAATSYIGYKVIKKALTNMYTRNS